MQRYARVVGGVVIEIIEIPDGKDLPAALAAECVLDESGTATANQIYADGVFSDPEPHTPDLATVQTRAKTRVDEEAEALRLQLLTPGEGQAQAYALKIEELAAYDQDIAGGGTPDPDDYPVCAAEIGITGADLATAMEAVRVQRAAWISWCAAIEGPRLQAKADIDAATDAAGVQAVLDFIVWPSHV